MTSLSTKRNHKASQKAKEGVSDTVLLANGYDMTVDNDLPPGSECTTKDNHLDLYYGDSSDSSEEGGMCDTSLKSFLSLKAKLTSIPDAPTTFLRRSSSSYSDNSLLSPTQTTEDPFSSASSDDEGVAPIVTDATSEEAKTMAKVEALENSCDDLTKMLKKGNLEGESDAKAKVRLARMAKLHTSESARLKQTIGLLKELVGSKSVSSQKASSEAAASSKLELELAKNTEKSRKRERDKEDASELHQKVRRQAEALKAAKAKAPKVNDTYSSFNYGQPPSGFPNSFGMPPPPFQYPAPPYQYHAHPTPDEKPSVLSEICASPMAAAFGKAFGNSLAGFMNQAGGAVKKTPEQGGEGNTEANKEN